ncbi:unnamed protein product [Rotaria sordida]|uniref:BZIP domain-containing protein n=1 Tax=Rotaria sordida TaxID=392033 RepID=A0A813V3I3_9BILA|nr:unnamed protein product [Rotaria sordida]CAF0832157.1 unnamed protein product [Rotaria sordida]
MMTSIQKMQSNDLLRSSTSPFVRSPHLLSNDLQSQLNMLYALTQQQISSSSSSSSSDLTLESQIKRIKKTIPMPNEPPSQVSLISATDSRTNSTSDREIVKVVTTAGPQCIDKEFLTQLLLRKDVIPARKRRDFIPNDMKDDHYWERRRKNNLAAKRSREKRRLNDIVLETKVVELTNENEALKAKLNLMLSRLNMKETEMESLFEEEQRLGHICLRPATSASTIISQRTLISDDDDYSSRSTRPKNSSSSETHDDDEVESTTFDDNSSNTRVQHPILYNQLLGNNNNGAVDLSRTEVKTGNLLTTIPSKSPSPLTPSPSPPNESLLQILANQILKTKQQDTVTSSSSRLLTIASPTESKPTISSLKRNFNQLQQDDEQQQQQQKWDEAAMALLSLNKPPPPPPSPVEQQQTALQSVCQSVINGLLRKSNPPRATIDYHSNNQQQIQGENFHHHHQDNINSFNQLKTLMNYFSTSSSNNSFSMPPLQQSSTYIPEQNNTITTHTQSHEPRGDMMPLKLRMKMLNAKS